MRYSKGINHYQKAKEVRNMSEEVLQTETMADLEAHFDDASPWNVIADYLEKGTVLTVKVEGVVNGGVIAVVEGVRGFIPASQLSLTYIENLEDFLLQEIEVQVIEADQAANRLILSARALLKAKEKAAKDALMASMQPGTVVKGTVESLQSYGAFVRLENGLSGLIHISQIANKRIKAASDVLKVGDEIEAKIIDVKQGKISLSRKALLAPEEPVEEENPKVEIPKAENIGTSLGDLFKNITL